VEFLDLGCSSGGSIAHCTARFGAQRGLGIDISPEKVRKSLANGVEAMVGDATRLELDKRVRFVSMMHFLEHLPDIDAVERAIASAAAAATDFLYIHHPSFEGEPYIESLGLRQYWWHWHGHPTHITVEDFCRIFEAAELGPYSIRYIEEVENSSHPTVLPASAPADQFEYDRAAHGPKPEVRFRKPIWRFQEIFVALRPLPSEDWRRITTPVPPGRGEPTSGDG
jgi:SAM-dependent methyltransferase